VNSSLLKKWIPGVLSNSQVRQLYHAGWIEKIVDPKAQLGYSALDLTLAGDCYQMLQGSVKPCGEDYNQVVLQNRRLARRMPKREAYVLQPKQTYLFPIQQRFGHQFLRSQALYGQATAKSSVGRMDVLARLIVDGMASYEEFTPEQVEKGNGRM